MIAVLILLASAVLALSGLLIYQQRFFMGQVQELLNKAMSRNYAEYSQTKVAEQPKQPRIEVQDQADDLRVLDGFNGF